MRESEGTRYKLSELAVDWRWLFDVDEYVLLGISPFGDLFMEDQTGALCLLDINLGVVEYATSDGVDPAVLFPISFDDRIASGYRDHGLTLRPGTCYGYKMPGVAGGSFEADNVYVATLTEYVSFMSHFHQEIRDVADGEKVTIKVIPGRVN